MKKENMKNGNSLIPVLTNNGFFILEELSFGMAARLEIASLAVARVVGYS